MYSLRDVLGYARMHGREGLLKGFLAKSNKFLLRYDTYTVGRIELSGVQEDSPQIPVTIRNAVSGDISSLRKVKYDTREFVSWLEKGYLFKVAESEGNVIGYIAMTTTPERPFQNVMELKPDEYWLVYSFVFPEYRRKKIFEYMLSTCAGELSGKGYKYLCMVINKKNPVSIKAHEKMGFTKTGDIKKIKILGFENVFC
jgi:L-amino acid N-acyltransferase YncA